MRWSLKKKHTPLHHLHVIHQNHPLHPTSWLKYTADAVSVLWTLTIFRLLLFSSLFTIFNMLPISCLLFIIFSFHSHPLMSPSFWCLTVSILLSHCFFVCFFTPTALPFVPVADCCWHTSSSHPQGRGTGLPAGPAGGPGGERADDDSGGPGSDVAGGVPANPDPDQWGADPHPPGTAGPGWHRAASYGEEWVVELWKCDRQTFVRMCIWSHFFMVAKTNMCGTENMNINHMNCYLTT